MNCNRVRSQTMPEARSRLLLCALLVCVGLLCCSCAWSQALQQLRVAHHDAAALVLDVSTGQVLQRFGDLERESLPGSVMKPFVLVTALRSGSIHEHDTAACRGTLMVAGHNLACSHPRDVTVLDARQALANSCNNYFAQVAARMPSATLVSGLRGYGLPAAKEPRDADERTLLALGLSSMDVSVMELARAYLRLAAEMNATPNSAATKTVRDGLLQSVQTGMANAARAQGVTLGGKTGTVDDPGGRSHGWFAGIIFNGLDAQVASRVMVVFVPNGNGADAASIAGTLLRRESLH